MKAMELNRQGVFSIGDDNLSSANRGSYEDQSATGGGSEDNLPPFLTVDEVAELLRINRNTVYELFQRNEIPGGRKVGRVIRFSRDVVIQWFRGNVLTSH